MLLVNLGTPDATDYWSMRRYLKEFLSDRRVIEENRVKWWLILNLIILSVRPGAQRPRLRQDLESGARTSPVSRRSRARRRRSSARRFVNDRAPAGRLGDALRQSVDRFAAGGDAAGRLRPHSGHAALSAIRRRDDGDGCRQGVRRACRYALAAGLRIAPPYYDQPTYIEALAGSLEEGLAKLPFKPGRIIASFHGMPEDYLKKGDPYYCQCAVTTRLLRARLGLDEQQLMMTFQSRFGRAEWLKPYTDETVKALAEQGVKNLAVITPGFAADCLETLEEIAMENAHIFKSAGGENFAHIPCLNDSERGMAVIRDVVTRELQGWL